MRTKCFVPGTEFDAASELESATAPPHQILKKLCALTFSVAHLRHARWHCYVSPHRHFVFELILHQGSRTIEATVFQRFIRDRFVFPNARTDWMFKQLLLAVTLAVSCLPIRASAEDDTASDRCPPENPPRILVASSVDESGRLVLVSYHSIFIGFQGYSYNERLTKPVSLQDVKIFTTKGEPKTIEFARKQIANRDTPIIATSYKEKLPKFYASMFSPETLVFAFPKRAPQWREIESPGAAVRK